MKIDRMLNVHRGLKFGVEIEFKNDVRREVVKYAQQHGVTIEVMGYTHQVTEGYWKIVTDSSCGYEVVSPILYDLKELEVICNALTQAGAIVDKSCGVHVHHDASDFDLDNIKNVYRAYSKYEKAIDSMLPKSRRNDNNVYCKSIVGEWTSNVERCNTISDLHYVMDRCNARYRKINTVSYFKYKTIEFRQHGASTDFEKIANWVMFTHMIMQRSEGKIVKAVTPARRSKWEEDEKHMMYDLYNEFSISGTVLANYIRDRRKAFKDKEGR